MWTKSDAGVLRSMGIASDDPPPALPRFRVEPAAMAGWYRVIDTDQDFSELQAFGPKAIPNARAAADDHAAQLNAKHVKK